LTEQLAHVRSDDQKQSGDREQDAYDDPPPLTVVSAKTSQIPAIMISRNATSARSTLV
jgi:hypothetical protein